MQLINEPIENETATIPYHLEFPINQVEEDDEDDRRRGGRRVAGGGREGSELRGEREWEERGHIERKSREKERE